MTGRPEGWQVVPEVVPDLRNHLTSGWFPRSRKSCSHKAGTTGTGNWFPVPPYKGNRYRTQPCREIRKAPPWGPLPVPSGRGRCRATES